MLPHLAARAKAKQTITYKELGELIGHPAFFLSGALDILRDKILIPNNLPSLDALVVNQETGEVGHMFYEGGRIEMDDAAYRELLDDERSRSSTSRIGMRSLSASAYTSAASRTSGDVALRS